MTVLTHLVSLALLHFVWQGTFVAIVLWIALLAMRKRSSNARYLASCGALAVLILAPIVTAIILYQRPTASSASSLTNLAAQTTVAAASASAATWIASLQDWAVPVWCVGVLVFSARLAWGSRQVSRMRRRGETAEEWVCAAVAGIAAQMGLNRRVDVLISALADGPSVIGLARPVILLPAATILGLTPEQLAAVLAHELAHIRRYDYLVNVLQMLAEALLFYHPAVWWISSRIRSERELCCDDEAVRVCGDALGYARALTTLERIRIATPTLALGGAAGPLAYRIKRLMGVSTEENPPSKAPAIVALCLALACLGLSVNRMRAQARPDAPGVRVDLGSSAVVHRAPVEYPAAAQIGNVTGMVSVEVHLDNTGNVSDARVLSGPDELRKPVLQSVLGWHFTPDAAGSTRVVNVQFETPRQAKPQAAAAAPEPIDDSNVGQDIQTTTDFLRKRIDQVKAGIEEFQARKEPHADPEVTKEALLARQAELQALEAKLAVAQRAQAGQNQDEIRARDAEVRAREAELSAMRAKLAQAQISRSLEGATLRSIRVIGLGLSKEDFLARAQLPVREGDRLTGSSMEAAAAAVKKFDEHLAAVWSPSAESDGGAVLTIAAPGASLSSAARAGGGRAGIGSGVGRGIGGGIGSGVGGGIAGPEDFQAATGTRGTAPVPIYNPPPEYTDEARNARWQGSVKLSLVVDETGRPTDVRVTKQVGMGLEQKAMEAVWKWRFKPGTIDGKPAPVAATVEVNFRLP
ncbi:MAG TPA: TonB family protein [Bryobacteraceae bacterium]|jgi:TonB family protein